MMANRGIAKDGSSNRKKESAAGKQRLTQFYAYDVASGYVAYVLE